MALNTPTPSLSVLPSVAPFEQTLQNWAALKDPAYKSVALESQAWRRFLTLGLPTARLEPWKHVDLALLRNNAWRLCETLSPAPTSAKIDTYAALPMGQSIRLVMVDGHYRPQLSSDISRLPVSWQPIDRATDADAPEVAEESDALALLNRAVSPGGQILWIPRETVIEPVIELVYLTTRAAQGSWQAPRLHIELEPGAQATVLIHWVGQTDVAYLVNGLVTVRLEDRARLRLIQRRAPSDRAMQLLTLQARQFGASCLESWSMATKGAVSRLSQTVELLGEGSTTHLTGLSVGHGESEIHQRVAVHHRAPGCKSEQLFKALAGGQARTEFDGSIRVDETATGTDARQLSRNLLLSAKAKAFARPWLQIDTDDVACSHGATVGQISETEVFYLMSRGIPKQQARALVTLGFARQVLDSLAIPALEGFFRKQITCALTSMVG